MTDREAMKQALEALELLSQQPIEMALDYADNAIDALRERLAQPEQEPVAWADEIIEDIHSLYDSEMIKELAEQAHCYAYEYAQRPDYNPHNPYNQLIYKKRYDSKFAELIVRKCIQVCNSRVGNIDYNTGRTHCASDEDRALQALAQPEQEPLQFKCTVIDDAHPNGVPLEQWGKQPEQEPVALPCCGYADASAVKWNPYSKTVQCHNCGQTYTPLAQPEQEPVIGKWSLREVYFDEDGEPISHRSPPQRKPLTNDLYNELLFAVETKCPDETRHQTALRYIRQAEMPSARPAQAAHGIKENRND